MKHESVGYLDKFCHPIDIMFKVFLLFLGLLAHYCFDCVVKSFASVFKFAYLVDSSKQEVFTISDDPRAYVLFTRPCGDFDPAEGTMNGISLSSWSSTHCIFTFFILIPRDTHCYSTAE